MCKLRAVWGSRWLSVVEGMCGLVEQQLGSSSGGGSSSTRIISPSVMDEGQPASCCGGSSSGNTCSNSSGIRPAAGTHSRAPAVGDCCKGFNTDCGRCGRPLAVACKTRMRLVGWAVWGVVLAAWLLGASRMFFTYGRTICMAAQVVWCLIQFSVCRGSGLRGTWVLGGLGQPVCISSRHRCVPCGQASIRVGVL